jgi:ABC-type nitrate/sulfonate/bicarbonate transport system permease component
MFSHTAQRYEQPAEYALVWTLLASVRRVAGPGLVAAAVHGTGAAFMLRHNSDVEAALLCCTGVGDTRLAA